MAICIRCGHEVAFTSRRGLCQGCGMNAVLNAARQMHEKKGPIYEKALARRKAATGQSKP